MKRVLSLTSRERADRKKKKNMVMIPVVLVSMVVVAAIGLTVYGQLSGDNKVSNLPKIESKMNIFQTEFGQKYKTELENMEGVGFYVRENSESNAAILKVKSSHSIDDNIVLIHMVYTHLNQILPEIDEKNIQVIAYDVKGTFFDTTDEKLEFTEAFCREDYIAAVEKKENLLYNSPLGTQ